MSGQYKSVQNIKTLSIVKAITIFQPFYHNYRSNRNSKLKGSQTNIFPVCPTVSALIKLCLDGVCFLMMIYDIISPVYPYITLILNITSILLIVYDDIINI